MPLRNHDDQRHRPPVRLRGALALTAVAVTMGAAAGCTTPAGTINAVFGTAAPQAMKIARCESDLNPSAVSRTDDHGLFQINIINKADFTRVTGQPWSAIYNTYYNTRYAKVKYDELGWEPWLCKYVLGL
jgi:hypothetical protein